MEILNNINVGAFKYILQEYLSYIMWEALQEKVKKGSKGAWKCCLCTFQNCQFLKQCQICQNPKPDGMKLIQAMKLAQKTGFKCEKCQYINQRLFQHCLCCQHPLIPEDEYDKAQKFNKKDQKQQQKEIIDKNIIKCSFCQNQNSIENKLCVFCDTSLNKQIKTAKITKNKQKNKQKPIKKICQFCHRHIHQSQLEIHQICCSKSNIKFITQQYNKFSLKNCPLCQISLISISLQSHKLTCSFFLTLSSSLSSPCLTGLQKQALTYLHQKSQKVHSLTQHALLQKIRTLGLESSSSPSCSSLFNLQHYITNLAPIIIHVRLADFIEKFIEDTHYRNAFQVTKSSISCRVGWENRMFDMKYQKAKFDERVKYGTINFTNDPKGVGVCEGYGASYFLLGDNVRPRCTMTDKDSSASIAIVGTLYFANHLIYCLSQDQLRAAFQASKGSQVQSDVIRNYKQIQIHGPVQFSKDVQRIYVNNKEIERNPKLPKLVKQFATKNNLQYQFFAQRSPPQGQY